MDVALPTRPHPAMRGIWRLRGIGLVLVLFPFLAWPLVLPIASLLRLLGTEFALSFFVAGGILLMAALAFALVWPSLAYARTRFEIGAQEIVIEQGVLVRRVTRIPCAKVRRVVLRTGPLLRRAGLASIRLVVEDRWASTPYPVDGQLAGVRDAPNVAQVLVERINRAKGVSATTSRPAAPLARLAPLRGLPRRCPYIRRSPRTSRGP